MTGKLIKWGIILAVAYFAWQWAKKFLTPVPTSGLQSLVQPGWTPYEGGVVLLQGGGPYPSYRQPRQRPRPY